MNLLLLISIFPLVLTMTSCCLLYIHLVYKRAEKSNYAFWVALGLCWAAVIGNMTVILNVNRVSLCNYEEFPVTTEDPVWDTSNRKKVSSENQDLSSEKMNLRLMTSIFALMPTMTTQKIQRRKHLVILSRREWMSQPPKSTTPLRHPVEYVVISQTATDPCTTQAECTLTVRYLQVFHVEGKKWMDIAYNFLVAGDGQAYEGRGWDVVGAHTAAGFNGISAGISFVGTFSDVLPPPVQIRACKLLIEEGIRLGKISPNYKLIADRQLSQSENPGMKLYEELQTWDHWTSKV